MPPYRRRRRPWGSRRGFLGLRHRTLRTIRNLLCGVLLFGGVSAGVFFVIDRQDVIFPTGGDMNTSTEDKRYPNDAPLDKRAIEQAIIKYTNEERLLAGMNALQERDAISRIARAHSENMVTLGLFHDLEGKDPTDRAEAAGWTCTWSTGYGLGENIYEYNRVGLWMGDRPVEYEEDADAMGRSLVTGWMESPGHRENILDRSYRLIGVGVAIYEDHGRDRIDEIVYATQNFSGCSP